MKKTAFFVLISVLVISFAACGETPATREPAAPGSPGAAQATAPTKLQADKPAYTVTYQKAITYTDSIGTTWVQTIVEIMNTGSVPLYLSSSSYDLEDADGKLIASQTLVSVYPDVLDVGERGYLYEETTLDNVSGGRELTVIPRIDAVAAKVGLIRNTVTDISITDESYGGIKVLGRVENMGDEAQDTTYVAIAFFDAGGAPIGLAFTILSDTLNAGDKIGFDATSLSLPESVKAASIASYTAYSYPMQAQF